MTVEQVVAHKREFMISFHPDRWLDPSDKARAEALFVKAQKSVEKKKSYKIKSSSREYIVEEPMASGDVSDVYKTVDEQHIVKLSICSVGNKMLKNEAKIFHDLNCPLFQNYAPKLVEHFTVKDKNKSVVNVFENDREVVPFSRIVNVDGVHACWIFNRLLELIEMLRDYKIAHTAIVPDHVLINPVMHRIKVVGWGHATLSKIGPVPAKYADWYPKWIDSNTPIVSSVKGFDVAFAAKTVLTMNRLHGRIKKFLEGCLVSDDVLDVHAEFKDLVESIYGPPKFVKLII